jgi:hypothetical protein
MLLWIAAAGRSEPTLVAACHCTECQRRTGAAFGVAAYFEKSQIKPEGPYREYVENRRRPGANRLILPQPTD